MSITVEIPAALRGIAMDKSEITASGATIRELVADIDRQYPGFQSRICYENGGIRKFVAVFVNDHDIRTLQKDMTPLQGNEKVCIVAAIAGG